ncbi:MAG: alpha-2-macroglobulin [Bacteroidales bacterium]|nr:alpha-2-macroglobulin [Bacteroidales bacterium]
MKRTVLALSFIAALLAAVSCGAPSGDSIASYSREIRVEDPVTVRLYDAFSMKDVDQAAAAAKKAVSISPKVDFDVQIVDQQTVCIIPKEPLDYNTTYKVTADFGKLAGVSGGKQTFEVKTLAPVLLFDYSKLTGYPGIDDKFQIDLELSSPEALDGKYLESGFSVKGADASVAWVHSDDGHNHTVTVGNIAAGDRKGAVTLNYSWPKYAAEGSRRYEIPAKGQFDVLESEVKLEPFGFEIAFSSALDPKQDFQSIVSMPGAGKLSFIVNENVLKIIPSVKASEKQFLSVSKAIRSTRGQKLDNDFDRWFDIPSGEPTVNFIARGSILPSSGDVNLPFQAINYAKARVRVKRIYENNVLQFLQSNSLNDYYCYTDNVARVVLDTTLVLGEPNSPRLRNLNTYGLNLSSLVKVERGAIYRIEIRGVDPLAEFSEDHYESDYYFGSYDNYEMRVRNILVSDLSVIAKGSDKGEYSIFVNDIISGQPVNGAKVVIYNSVNQPIAEGSTSSGGKFTCRVPDDRARTVVVSKGSDKSYLSMASGSSISMSGFEVDGNASVQGQKGFIFGERGVWRPGDDIHITFISMLDEGVLPANHPVTAVLRNPQGQTISTLVNNTGFDGMYGFTFKTGADAPTGNWEVAVTAGGMTWYKTVKIETVKPNNIVIDLTLNDKPALPIGNIRGQVAARWLVGNPARDLEVRVDAEFFSGHTSFDNYKGYQFEDRSRSFSSQELEVYHGKTDANGQLSFNAGFKESNAVPGMVNARFTTRVFEKSGDFSIDRYTTKVSLYDTYIGILVPEKENEWGESYLDKGKNNTFKLVAVDYKGQTVPRNVKVNIEVYKMGWSWWWSSSSDGLASYAKDSYNKPFKEMSVNLSSGTGEFSLDLSKEESGYYFIRVTDPAGGHATSAVTLVQYEYDNVADANSDAAVRLPMSLNKDKFAVGENAILTIPSASGARALVSIEKGERVLKTFWVDCKGDKTEISVPVEAGMAPNVYAAVTLVQPYNNSDNDAPIRMFGVQRIMVEEPATHLKPVIDIAAEIQPEKEVSFTVKEEDGRPMSYVVALVDEGLLSLTRFKTPDPWNSFYATEALGVRTWDLYDLIIGAYGARMEQLFAIGGDSEGDAPVTPNSQADRFKPVSIFLGPYTVKARGTAKHTVEIPQYIGQLRAMVIATDGSAMGSSEKKVMVTKPVMVKATLPRVIGTDEEVVLPVTVFTNKDGVGNVTVDVTAEGALSVVGSGSSSVSAPKAGEQLAWFTLKASDLAGIGKIRTVAKGGGDSSKEDLEIDIREPNPRTTNSVVKLVEGGKSLKVPFALAGRPGTNEVNVEASTIPPIDLDYRLGYLTGYPHGCIEQTVSAVFPQLYLGELMELSADDKAKIEKNVKAAVTRLNSFAIPAGGMTYWPGMSAYQGASVWGTIYATHFMLEAQKAGYAVPAALRKSNLTFLKSVASGKGYDSDSRAYACYVLALAGSPDRGDMNRLREDIAKLPYSSGLLLAGAYVLDGKKDVANTILQNVRTGDQSYNRFSSNFDSEERVQAIAAMVHSAVGEKKAAFQNVEKLSNWLNDRKHYMSTQSTAWALRAVADYMKNNAVDGLDVSVKAGSSSSTLRGKKAIARGSLDPGNGTSLDLEITNSSKAPVYVVVSSTGVPEKGQEVARADGLQLSVKYTLPDGTPIDPSDLEQGTDFYMYTYITNTSSTTDYTNLALIQIFPSGWEIHVDRIEGFYQDFRDDRIYSYIYQGRNSTSWLRTRLTATYKGRFYRPAIVCEAMYDNTIGASVPGGWVTVR